MIAALASEHEAHKEHAFLAEVKYVERAIGQVSSLEDMLGDWYSARAALGTYKAVSNLLNLLRQPAQATRDIVVEEALLDKLQYTNVEDCKAVLAWLAWNRGGRQADSNQVRMAEDWWSACRELSNALRPPPPHRRSDLVRRWVRERYFDNRDLTLREKAYAHSLGSRRRGPIGDYSGAERYLDQIRGLASDMVASGAGRQAYESYVSYVFDGDNWQWIDFMEFILPRVCDITPAEGASIEQDHRFLAMKCCCRRVADRISSPEEKLADWCSAGYGAGKAVQILGELANRGSNGSDVVLSRPIAAELQTTGVEECKALLSWWLWKQNSGIADWDGPRMLRDWCAAEAKIRQAIDSSPPRRREDSVRTWVRRRYRVEGERTILEKAYLHSRGPFRRGHLGNYHGAQEYVSRVADLAEAMVAEGAGGQAHRDFVAFLFSEERWRWEDAMELLLPHVVDITEG